MDAGQSGAPSSIAEAGAAGSDQPGVKGCSGGQTEVNNYPAGPYGIEPGQTLADFCLQGFRSAEATVLSNVALHDFYAPASTTGARVLLLSGAMLWCQPCNRQALQLPELSASVANEQIALLQVLLDGPEYAVGSVEADLREWQSTYSIPFWVTTDPSRLTADYFPPPHPPAIIVDTRTMKVLERVHGYETAASLRDKLLKWLVSR
jgi:hypothetical protein